jgi:hypothetical protein
MARWIARIETIAITQEFLYANSGFDLTKTGHAGTLLVAETTKGAPE